MKKVNNYSRSHTQYLRRLRSKKAWILTTQIMIIVAVVALWQLLADAKLIDVFFFSSPTRIFAVIKDLYETNMLFYHIWVTLSETLLAFGIASLIGFIIAALLWQSDFIRKVCEPYLVILNSLPKIALGPLIILWIGTGQKAIVTMAVLIVVIVTTLNILTSFLSVDENKVTLMRSFGATKLQIFWHLIIPNSRNDIVSTLKINVGLSWIGSIMGEYLVCKAGLGYLLIYGQQTINLDLVMASILILCVLAAGMYFVIALAERIICREKT